MTNAVPAPVNELLQVARHVTPTWLRRLASGVAGSSASGPGGPESQPGSETALWPGIESLVDSCAASVMSDLEALLCQDVEAQRRNPLAVFRSATAPLTAHLVAMGYPARPRDRFDIERFPDDVYGFAPASWSDIDPALVAPGMAWGAWKAMTIISRHRNDDSTDR